jgi:hypothetical protein
VGHFQSHQSPQHHVSKKHCQIENVFQIQVKAEGWLDEEELMIPDLVPRDLAQRDNDSHNDSSESKVDEASAKENLLKKKNQANKARRREEKKVSQAKAKKTP